MPNGSTTTKALPVDGRFAVPAPEDQLELAAEALRGHGFTVHIVDDAAAARELVTGLLPTDRGVFTATSETLRECGLADDIDRSGRFPLMLGAAATHLRAKDPAKALAPAVLTLLLAAAYIVLTV